MYFGQSWLIWIAIALLMVGILFRFLPRVTEDADGNEKGSQKEGGDTVPP
jgi:hypothetical protein